MRKGDKRFLGAAAMTVLSAASLAAASTASAADVICVTECVVEPPTYNAPGLNTAFNKLAQKGFPGATLSAFLTKVDTQNAFNKLAQKGFPGNTGEIFIK